MTTPTLREQFVSLRQESGVSQAELAQWIGVTQTAVSYWESGRRQPGLDDVERWAAALGATPSLLQGSPTAGSKLLAGDLVGRLTAALLTEPWTDSPRSAHGEHRYDASCAICQGDVDRIAAFVVRAMEPEALAAEVDAFHRHGEKLANAYDLRVKAAALRDAADDWDALGSPVAESPVSTWLRALADAAEGAAERLQASVPRPAGGGCQVVEVDGEPVRVQAAPDMPGEVRDALADVVRSVRRNHDRTLSDQETVAPDRLSGSGKESFPLRDRLADAIRQVVRISPGPSALADLNAGRSIAISGGEADDAALAALPVVEAWAVEQTQRADDRAEAAGYEATSARLDLREAERERDEARAAVQRVRDVSAWLRGSDDEMTAIADRIDTALDQPDDTPPKPCPLGYRLHRPHTWTDGGPLRACPGVTDQPEDHRG